MEDLTTEHQMGSQETTMVGAIGSNFDLGSVRNPSAQWRRRGDLFCGTPSVREGEFVDIEVNSGSEVSCLPASIGADTYHPGQNDYRCKSLINSKTISVSKKITELFFAGLINSKNIMSA